MRLKHIKLAGFKSFVDPTKVPFEQQMTAIVGPNGCGKSNIIDAVRWVLGESSAKNLRGDAMTDVIFNGASSRKAIGQASVELMFDNVLGKIEGSLADRNQVSVRRVVNRDSQNSYYLNGSKCRRKDITDIFLGTGLGPRSYAIIEQGTISRLIESKPHELRVFIEEAAGISKYKERRKDTENRIRQTRENLARLTDIRIELDHQLDKLNQQAEAAQHFKTLKTQERTIKAELAVLRWQKFDQICRDKNNVITELNQQITQQEQLQQSDNIAISTAKQKLHIARDKIQHIQQQKITLTNDIARVEQQLKFVKQQQAKLIEDKRSNALHMEHAQQSLLAEQQQLEKLTNELESHHQLLKSFSTRLASSKRDMETDTATLNKLQGEWEQATEHAKIVSKAVQETTNDRAVIAAEIKQKELRLSAVEQNVTTLTAQYHQQCSEERLSELAAPEDLHSEVLAIQQKIEQLNDQHQQCDSEIETFQQQLNELTSSESSLIKQIAFINDKVSLTDDWENSQQQWLFDNKVIDKGTVASHLHIDEGWELAVQVALSNVLQSHVVDDFSLSQLEQANNELSKFSRLALIKQRTNTPQLTRGSLAEKVQGMPIISGILNLIKVANSTEQAIALVTSLAPEESVITPEGLWISDHFVVKGIADGQRNTLLLKRELTQLTDSIAVIKKDLETLQQSLTSSLSLRTSVRNKINENKNLLAQKQQQLFQQQQQQKLTLQSKQLHDQQLASLHDEKKLINHELVELYSKLDKLIDNKTNSQLNDEAAFVEQKAQQLWQQIQQYQQSLHEKQRQQAELNEQKHHAALNVEKTKHLVQQRQQNIVRFQDNIAQLTQQRSANIALSEKNEQPLHDDEQLLQAWLAQMSELDRQQKTLQQQLESEQDIINKIEQSQHKEVELLAQLTSKMNQRHLEAESAKIKAESALEQLLSMNKNLGDVQKNMPDNARESQWQAQLIKLGKDIQVLGPINLTAIDEFNTQVTRKNYLDQQDQDLNLAITTLESAIEKIDKESRHKFKTTFDNVNQDLQMLFPKVFGGGNAYLTLTGDDLLETGVTVMARPPGKKNSTIHLLSGGEKALTALSLVFAIFRLNPAPFCMLDEVDAPLDDANVSRFCNLVKEMSKTVQFIYISHNKIAMEMATHLTGVTMFEPGVSRMVSVDIDEAVAMAEVS